MSLKIVVFAEHAGDAAILRSLIDRVLQERGPDWCNEPHTYDHGREWSDLGTGAGYLSRGEVKERMAALGRRKPFGRKRSPEERVLVKLLLAVGDAADAVVVHSDTDGSSTHASTYRDATGQVGGLIWAFAIPHPEMEAWGLWALDESPEHRQRASTVKQRVGVDPMAHPHRLSSAPVSKKEIKAIAREFGIHGPKDVEQAVCNCPMDRLRSGDEVGLAAFIADVEAGIITAIQGRP